MITSFYEWMALKEDGKRGEMRNRGQRWPRRQDWPIYHAQNVVYTSDNPVMNKFDAGIDRQMGVDDRDAGQLIADAFKKKHHDLWSALDNWLMTNDKKQPTIDDLVQGILSYNDHNQASTLKRLIDFGNKAMSGQDPFETPATASTTVKPKRTRAKKKVAPAQPPQEQEPLTQPYQTYTVSGGSGNWSPYSFQTWVGQTHHDPVDSFLSDFKTRNPQHYWDLVGMAAKYRKTPAELAQEFLVQRKMSPEDFEREIAGSLDHHRRVNP